MNEQQIRELARRGAQQRLQEIDAERASIIFEFPDLPAGDLPIVARAQAAELGQARKRRPMSPAERKAVAAKRMRAAKRKGGKA